MPSFADKISRTPMIAIRSKIRNLTRRKSPWTRGQRRFDEGTYESVGAFLKKHGLDPCPENYALVFKFVIKNDTNLLDAIGDLMKTGYARDQQRFPDITGQFEADLATLANNTQMQLESIEHIILRSRGDAKEFGNALEGATGELQLQNQVDPQALISLCDLTREMISKTRSVETELRSRSNAIQGLIGSLDEAKNKADTDVLTGLSNRRAFERQLGATVERASRDGIDCALAICDIDQFKSINDKHGHQTGDRVIKLVAESLERHCLGKGHVFRFGGEEYVILFENLPFSEALKCVEEARHSLAERQFRNLDTKGPIGVITFSGGLSALGKNDSPSALLGNADRALYKAKSEGRNCVKVVMSI